MLCFYTIVNKKFTKLKKKWGFNSTFSVIRLFIYKREKNEKIIFINTIEKKN